MKEQIYSDLFRIFPKQQFSVCDIIKNMKHPGFKYMLFFRIASANCNLLIKLASRLILKRLRYKFGFQLVPGTLIGNGFYIGHFGPIIINPSSKIGKNCNISPGVTIGKIHSGRKFGSPTIGNNVWIGTNAIILGNINISDNVLIAPGAYVNFDVPENSIVIGNPGKISYKENPTKYYVNNTIK